MPVLSFLTTLTVNKTDQKGHGDIVVASTPSFQPAAGTHTPAWKLHITPQRLHLGHLVIPLLRENYMCFSTWCYGSDNIKL